MISKTFQKISDAINLTHHDAFTAHILAAAANFIREHPHMKPLDQWTDDEFINWRETIR